MNKESLLEKRATVETKFSELQEQQKQTNEELIRLQGEYRTLTTLIDDIEKEATQSVEVTNKKEK